MKSANKVFTEIGFDLDNNRFAFGRSVEIEYPDGSEIRQKNSVSADRIQSRYLRLWLGKRVLIVDSQSPHFSLKKKNRRNFKLVLGKWGFVSADRNSVSSHRNQNLKKEQT